MLHNEKYLSTIFSIASIEIVIRNCVKGGPQKTHIDMLFMVINQFQLFLYGEGVLRIRHLPLPPSSSSSVISFPCQLLFCFTYASFQQKPIKHMHIFYSLYLHMLNRADVDRGPHQRISIINFAFGLEYLGVRMWSYTRIRIQNQHKERYWHKVNRDK